MKKSKLLEELEFVNNGDAEVFIADEEGNIYEIEDFGTNFNETEISILVKKESPSLKPEK